MKILHYILIAGLCFGIYKAGLLRSENLHWDSWVTATQNSYFRLQNWVSNWLTHRGKDDSRVETILIDSNALGEKREVWVYLPPGYQENVDKHYPTLYLLHGFPGNDRDWVINANLEPTLDGLIKVGKLPPMIVVFPDGNGKDVRDSQYINATLVKQNMEDYLVELVGYTDANYRTMNDRRSRAVGGLSSGAYGASNLALKHNELFSVILSLSGYFENHEYATNLLVGPDDESRSKYNPLSYTPSLTLNPETYVYMTIGKSDYKEFVEQNHKFDDLLTTMEIPHELQVVDGGHSWINWRRTIPGALLYLGEHIRST